MLRHALRHTLFLAALLFAQLGQVTLATDTGPESAPEPAAASSAQLPPAISLALQQAGIPETHIGLVVQELDGTPLIQHGADRAFNPASVMKLVTTLAALDLLGPAYTFKTQVWLDGNLKEGVLTGNLILQGGGDPSLTAERFWLLLRELRQRGLRDIQGDVLLDNRLYALPAQDPGAFDQAPLRPYNAPPAALLVNFNTHALRLSMQDGKPVARLDPPAPGILIENRLLPTDEPCNGWSERLSARVETPATTAPSLVLEGRYASVCGERALPLNLQTPLATSANWFSAVWQELGGSLSGSVREGSATTPISETPFASFESESLAQLVRDINKFSNNVMAKMLFLNLGAQRFGAPATTEKSIQTVQTWLAERQQTLPKLVLENGAGLSRLERLTAGGLAHLLGWAAQQPAYYEFAASLPAAGLEGTQKNRFNDSTTQGKAWLKSGTLNGARNLAGYVMGPTGQRRVLVLLISHPKAAYAGTLQQAVLEWTLKEVPSRPTVP